MTSVDSDEPGHDAKADLSLHCLHKGSWIFRLPLLLEIENTPCINPCFAESKPQNPVINTCNRSRMFYQRGSIFDNLFFFS